MEAMIQRIDEERYDSGRPAPNFRVNLMESVTDTVGINTPQY